MVKCSLKTFMGRSSWQSVPQSLFLVRSGASRVNCFCGTELTPSRLNRTKTTLTQFLFFTIWLSLWTHDPTQICYAFSYLETARAPLTLWMTTVPPAFCIRSLSDGLNGLWSLVEKATCPFRHTKPLESPQFPIKICKRNQNVTKLECPYYWKRSRSIEIRTDASLVLVQL